MSSKVVPAVVAILIAVAIFAVWPGYTTFTDTMDETFQIASGMEWLDKGTYTYEAQHPPLARVAVALGPYLAGFRSHSLLNPVFEGTAILYDGGKYWTTLRLARLGSLPFLILACVLVFLWCRRWFSDAAGLWAVLLFVHLPPILGHGSLATLDMAATATVIAALYQLLRWYENPSWQRSLWLGATLVLAILCKFSAFAFLPVCGAIVLLCVRLVRSAKPSLKHTFRQVSLITLVTFLGVWAGYRFSLDANWYNPFQNPKIDLYLAQRPELAQQVRQVIDTPIPLARMVEGIGQVIDHNKRGHDAFLLGEFRMTGWWYFFPLVVALKTPIGFLILALFGLGLCLWNFRARPWQQVVTALFPIAILLVCMKSQLNLGVRHALAIYPFLAVAAGYGISRFTEIMLAKGKPRWMAYAPALLVIWVMADSWMARPDYFAYFNQFAGAEPAKIECDSDLDWGQDLHRLIKRLNELHVQHISMHYFGVAPLDKVGLPEFSELSPTEPTKGWIALSLRSLYLENAKSGAYSWLKGATPVERIGKSIDLYYLP